ncbi:C40 family peptidase [Streptomyces sp. NPDC056549]|uniref:C40 family peptidase n=1 Tax=Streptomyces sp. NPDC056549 TaxID=3345864 RepID=UPI003692F091
MSLLAAFGTKRMIQRHHRSSGTATSAGHNPAVPVAKVGSDPGSLDLLDLALRTLAYHANERGCEIPAVTGARITARTVDIVLPAAESHSNAGSGQVLPPFVEVGVRRWELDRTQPLLNPDEASRIPAPYPGLVTIGADLVGNPLLINLTPSRVLLLDGAPEAVRATARALVLEAATSAWSEHSEIITVGTGERLPDLFPQRQMHAAPSPRAARAALADRVLHKRQTDDGDLLYPGPSWTLVCAADMEQDEAWRLADLLGTAHDGPYALVLPAEGTAGAFRAFDEAVRLTVGVARSQYVNALSSDVVVQSLPDADYKNLLDRLSQADEPAELATTPRRTPDLHQGTPTAEDGGESTGPAEQPDRPSAALPVPRGVSPVSKPIAKPKSTAASPAPVTSSNEHAKASGRDDAKAPSESGGREPAHSYTRASPLLEQQTPGTTSSPVKSAALSEYELEAAAASADLEDVRKTLKTKTRTQRKLVKAQKLLLALAAAEIAKTTEDEPSLTRDTNGQVQRGVIALAQAATQLGKPYVAGAEGPNSYDSSALVMWAYRQAGIQISRTTYNQQHDGIRIERKGLSLGDLVFFDDLLHVGIYAGNGTVLHVSALSLIVEYEAIDNVGTFQFGVRV